MRPADAARAAKEDLKEAGIDEESTTGQTAFAEILRHYLAGAGVPSAKDSRTREDDEGGDGHDSASRLAEWLGVHQDAIDDIASFGVEGVDIELHTSLLPTSKAARQRLLSILKLGFDRVAYGRTEVPAREINAICARYDCLDQNLPAHLESYGNYITRKGSRGSASYRLTQFGVDEAREQIRTLLGAA